MSSSPQPSTASEDAEETPTQKKYKGVRLRNWGKLVSEIRLPNSRERVWLGSYDTPEKAARAFDAAFICLRGPGAEGGINFPNSPPSVRCRSCDPQVMQAAALSHANRVTTHEGAVDSAVLMDVDSSTNATAAWASQGLVVPDVDVGNEVVAPVQADGSIDWSPMMANPPPLFSPIGFGSNAYGFLLIPPATVTADAAEDGMEENDNGASTSIWSFLAGESNFKY